MFNLYQHMQKNEEAKQEPQTTGHDRFYQERSRSYRRKKKKPACRRAHSSADLHPPSSPAASSKRSLFNLRSVSTDKEDTNSEAEESTEKTPLVAQKLDSLAKLIFNKSFIGSPTSSNRCSPNDSGSSPRRGEKSVYSTAATAICKEYLLRSTRYQYISNVNAIGSRSDRHWFAITDNSIKADRLLSLMPLGKQCPIEPTEHNKTLIVELFHALHHPYVYPILDVDFYAGHIITIIPFTPNGSLKDLIYKSYWNDDYEKKYTDKGQDGLPVWQVGRVGRQVLEGLLFLREKGFPPFLHLHTGNVILQNGVARISGLENSIVRAKPLHACAQSEQMSESVAFGRVVFEMCTGTSLDSEQLPHSGYLHLALDRHPQVIDILKAIFSPNPPDIHELLMFDFFRKIDLREMKGPSQPNMSQRLSASCMTLLGAVSRRSPETPMRYYSSGDDYYDDRLYVQD